MDFSKILSHKWVTKWGKYLIVIVVSGIIFIFIGDQSIVRFVQRGREIRHLEEQRDKYKAATEEVRREIQALHHTDSLERFAREEYYMHTANEDVYLVDEQ